MVSTECIRPDEPGMGVNNEDTPVTSLMARVLERENLRCALKQVIHNKGAPGIDGMTVEQLPGYLKHHWPTLKDQLQRGHYHPHSVKRITIPKPAGGERHLGVPTVIDRFIQQALLQVLQQDWDDSFSDSSFGFRPKRSAHQAIRQAQQYVREGYRWTVDMDLEKFFDSVNHDILMQRIKQRIDEQAVLILIYRILKADISINGDRQPNRAGTPQGGPLSRCWPTCCWMTWIKHWKREAIALHVMPTARRYRRETYGVKVPWPQLSVRGPSRRSGLRSDPLAQVTLNERCKAVGCNKSELESAS